VAAIPEGLPAILTITLALGVQRMARRNAIVRRLPAVETLGSVTTICSDKTGTLTRNEMTAARVLTAARVFHVTGSGYSPEGRFELDGQAVSAGDHPVLLDIARVSVLCNDAEFSQDSEHGDRVLQGDPTEGAMLVLGEKAGVDQDETRAHPRLDVIPFESENRFMATLNGDPDGKRWVLLKGAPERVLEMCEQVRAEDGDAELDREAWQRRIDAVAAEGFRMLAVARKEAPPGQDSLSMDDVRGGLTLLGAAGLIDPPRPEAIEAVAQCRSAGIRVKMVTGDHALTARSIAAQLGIGDGSGAITGKDLEAASDEQLVALVQ
jgi:magnesium-transporting ATPase (P-type)